METSLIVNSTTQTNTKKQRSFTSVNPEASNADLQTFAQKVVAMTNNSYSGATRVNKIDVTEPDPSPSSKTEPTLTLGPFGSERWGSYRRAELTYETDGELFSKAFYQNASSETVYLESYPTVVSGVQYLYVATGVPTGSTATVEVYLSEGQNYAAKKVTGSLSG